MTDTNSTDSGTHARKTKLEEYVADLPATAVPPPAELTLLSIALSLKRIADALNEPNEYGEVGSAALAGAITRSLRNG